MIEGFNPGGLKTQSNIFVTPDGYMYFQGTDHAVWRVNVADASDPTNFGGPTTIKTQSNIFVGPDGYLYFQGTDQAVWRMSPTNPSDRTNFGGPNVIKTQSDIFVAHDGYMYFQGTDQAVWRMSPTNPSDRTNFGGPTTCSGCTRTARSTRRGGMRTWRAARGIPPASLPRPRPARRLADRSPWPRAGPITWTCSGCTRTARSTRRGGMRTWRVARGIPPASSPPRIRARQFRELVRSARFLHHSFDMQSSSPCESRTHARAAPEGRFLDSPGAVDYPNPRTRRVHLRGDRARRDVLSEDAASRAGVNPMPVADSPARARTSDPQGDRRSFR